MLITMFPQMIERSCERSKMNFKANENVLISPWIRPDSRSETIADIKKSGLGLLKSVIAAKGKGEL